MILSETQARKIIETALGLSSADEARVNLWGGRAGNTRFALNSVTTCGDEDSLSIEVTACFGQRHASASGTEVAAAALRRLVAKAEELARAAPEDPEYVPELEPQSYLSITPYFGSTAKATPKLRADAALSAIQLGTEKGLTTAGFFEHSHGFAAVGNNKGLFGYHLHSDASFSVTARTPDGRGSGWASDNSRDIAEVDYRPVSQRAIAKAEASREPEPLEPGVYPVLLEPAAVEEFMQFAVWAMNARFADEGRSFYSKPGGGNRIGLKIVGENVTLRSDPTCPAVLGAPFGGDGLPARPRAWIENGVLKQLFYDRFWAQKQGKEPTGHPANLIWQGGTGSVEDLIRSTDRAVLITRFWYIRHVDPQTILVTGLTRDGLFWVENGQIRRSLKNLRFNESPIAVLSKVTGMSKPVRVGNSLVPAIRASEFTFSSASDSV